jgi:PmbA protein
MEINLYEDIESKFRHLESLAKKDGVELELIVEKGDALGLSVSKGKLEKFDSSQTQVGGIRIVLNGVEGYSWTESLETPDLEAAYRDALEGARFTSRGESQKVRVELWGSGSMKVVEDPSLFNDSREKVPLESKIERAKLLESKSLGRDSRIANVPYNRYSETSGEVMIFNSKGVRARQRRSGVMGYTYCLAKSGEGATAESRMAGESFFTRNALNVPIDDVAAAAAEKAVAKLGAVSPETGRYPIVIDCEVAAELFGLIADYFSAKSLAEKTTIYAKEKNPLSNLGQTIGSPLLEIVDDPRLEGGVGNRPFDAEGVPTNKTTLVERGILKSFLSNSVYAKRLGLPHTANASRGARSQLDVAPSNLVVKGGQESLQELLARYPKVIYITDFTGYHAGFQHGSGAFSFQSEGELWENGQRVSALCNFVVAGSIDEMLKGLEKVSSRQSPKTSNVVAPDLLISSLSVAGS